MSFEIGVLFIELYVPSYLYRNHIFLSGALSLVSQSEILLSMSDPGWAIDQQERPRRTLDEAGKNTFPNLRYVSRHKKVLSN